LYKSTHIQLTHFTLKLILHFTKKNAAPNYIYAIDDFFVPIKAKKDTQTDFFYQFFSSTERTMIRILLLLLVTTQLTNGAEQKIVKVFEGKHLIVSVQNVRKQIIINILHHFDLPL